MRNKETFELVLGELNTIKGEHESQMAKFDLLIDKQRRRYEAKL